MKTKFFQFCVLKQDGNDRVKTQIRHKMSATKKGFEFGRERDIRSRSDQKIWSSQKYFAHLTEEGKEILFHFFPQFLIHEIKEIILKDDSYERAHMQI